MSEYRQDRITGAWALIAPERGRRPIEGHRHDAPADRPAPIDPDCPFCPGNEHLLAALIDEAPGDAPPGWRTRVVPNKFPALRPDAAQAPSEGPVLPGFGHHEVIIETPRHDAELAMLSGLEIDAVMQSCRRRSAALIAAPGIEAVFVFRNHGRGAGASLAHPHSQVIATGMIPPRLAAATAWARACHDRTARCATCEELQAELSDGSRVVEATEHFAVIVPFAATCPFELRILPRRHRGAFDGTGDVELAELCRVLQRTLRRLKQVAGDPPYNFVIDSAPKGDADAPWAHWGLHIVPGLTRPGGFELGAGLRINPSLPEEDAAALRAV